MADMTIRAASLSDAQRIVALVNLAFRVESFFVDGDRTDLNQSKAMFQTGTFLLAKAAGQLAGCLQFELPGDRAYWGLLSADPSWQRQDVGRALVGKAERRASEAGCNFMERAHPST
jgi:GNAT superfamily N-acetyltransferase